jgi:hypothetical protein
MQEYVEKAQKILDPLFVFIKRYAVILFVIFFAGLGIYLVMKIDEFSRVDPGIAQVETRLSEVKKSRIDEDTITALEQLEDKNISIESLFNNGRVNPFED